MAIFEVQGPDGKTYEVDAPDINSAAAAVSGMATPIKPNPDGTYGPPPPPGAGVVANFGVGTQRGIANMAGMPVDAVSGAISGLGNATGLWGPIEKPFGGSESLYGMMEPIHGSIPDPQNRSERIARRIGEDVGTTAITAPVAAAVVPARAGAAALADIASAFGSGTSAAAAREIAPDSALAEIAASLAGGALAGGATIRAIDAGSKRATIRPGIDEQRAIADDAYSAVRNDKRVVKQQSVDDLVGNMDARLASEKMSQRLHPRASGAMEDLRDDAMNYARKNIDAIEQDRRFIKRNVSSSLEPEEKRLGQIMANEIDDYLGGLKATDMEAGTDPAETIAALLEGRSAHRRAQAAETIEQATTKAQRRAASTGSGGNEINATRQNIRSLLDNPKKAMSFTPEERAAMEKVVRGTPAGNAARRVSRFAPSSGGLSAMLGVGGAAAMPHVAVPLAGIAEAGKFLGERSIRKSADALMKMIAPDRVIKPGERGVTDIIRALLAARATANQ